MKLVIHTPLAAESAIGAAASLVGDELLARGHEVIYVDSSTASGPSHHPRALAWGDDGAITEAHRSADAIIYHIGNHLDYHAGGLEWLSRDPGIVVMHDFFLGHLFYAWAQTADRDLVDRILDEVYDLSIEELNAMTALDSQIGRGSFAERAAQRAPMVEWIAALSEGVVVHSLWDARRVATWSPGPIRRIPLAYEPRARAACSPRSSDKITVLSFGHINHNKLVHEIIESVGSRIELLDNVAVRVAGPVEAEYAVDLSVRAAALGVDLVLTGPPDDQTLAQELADADIVCCLRLPAFESASASAIEALKSGRPTIVVDTGFYSELPDDAVIKISADSIRADLGEVLLTLAGSPTMRHALGHRARAYAESEFSATHYADELLRFIEEMGAWQPTLRSVREAARQLVEWRGAHHPAIMRHIVDPLDFAFGPGIS